MAGTSFGIAIHDEPLAFALRGMDAAGGDLTPAMDVVGAALVTSTQLRFERGEAPGGNPWPSSFRARVAGGQTLIDRGRLRDSITHEPSSHGVRVGTNVIYAAIHQFGGIIVAKSAPQLAFRLADGGLALVDQVEIPARPFLGIDRGDETMIAEELFDYFAAAGQVGQA